MVVDLSGCVSLQYVCLALPVTGGGRAQCVIGFEGSAALTFWAAGVNRGCTVPKGLARGSLAPDPQGQSVRRCCSVSVYLCCRSSSIYFISLSSKLSLNWWLYTPSVPLTHNPTPQFHLCTPLTSKWHSPPSAHTSFSYVNWLGCLFLSECHFACSPV